MNYFWVTVFLAVLTLCVTGRLGSRVKGRQGVAIKPTHEKSKPNTKLRIASLNIQYGRGTDQQLDLARTASVLKDCDFVALQEVSGMRSSNQPNQAAVLGSILDMGWLFAPTKTRWFKP